MILHFSITKPGKAQGVSTVVSQFETDEFQISGHVVSRIEDDIESKTDGERGAKNIQSSFRSNLVKRLKNMNWIYISVMLLWAYRVTRIKHDVLKKADLIICHDIFTLIFINFKSNGNKRLCLYNHSDGDPFDTLMMNHGSFLAWPLLSLIKFLYKRIHIHTIYSLSNVATERIKQTFGTRSEYKVINNFISSETPLGHFNHSLNIWMIGTVCERKRQLQLFKKLSECKEVSIPSITVVGIAESSEVEQIKQYPFVNYLGVLKDLSSRIQYGDIVLSVSSNEGLPMSMIEGAAQGALILSTDVGGCKTICRDKINGYLYPIDFDENQLLNDILSLKENPEVRIEMGKNSYSLYQKEFSSASAIEFWKDEIVAIRKKS